MAKVTHFEILGTDAAGLRQFYGALFDWKIDADNPMDYGMVEHVENGIGGGITVAEDGKPRIGIAVEVDSIQPFLDKAVSLGGKVVTQRTIIPGVVTYAEFQDPQGIVVGLAESETPPAQ